MRSAGGDVSLKYFKKRETDEGVRAYLGDQRGWDWFAESFFRGGRWPRPRQQISWSHGHVFVRAGGGRILRRSRPASSSRSRWSRGQRPRLLKTRSRRTCRFGWIMRSAAPWGCEWALTSQQARARNRQNPRPNKRDRTAGQLHAVRRQPEGSVVRRLLQSLNNKAPA